MGAGNGQVGGPVVTLAEHQSEFKEKQRRARKVSVGEVEDYLLTFAREMHGQFITQYGALATELRDLRRALVPGLPDGGDTD